VNNVSPPQREKNQNATGNTLSWRLSEAIHWTTKRVAKKACASSPTDSQNRSELSVSRPRDVDFESRFWYSDQA
jgi:hypothetical protein